MQQLFPPEYPDCPDAPLRSFGPSFSEEISRSVVQAVWYENPDLPHETEVRAAASLTMLEAFRPRDHLECMMAAQAVAIHAAIMESLRRATHPDTAGAASIKLRANVVQLHRSFSLTLRDMERRQSKPLPDRPKAPPPDPVPTSTPPSGAPDSDNPSSENLSDQYELPEDIEARPDGTPGSLTGYTHKPPQEEYIPREPAIMVALATRPKPWRMVNAPQANAVEADPVAREDPKADPPPRAGRGPVDVHEKIFSGDALARFASARFDPHAPVEPLRFDEEDSVVELELISTGGDPEAEAERAAMMAAHPEGKPIVTIRHGSKKPPDKPPEDGSD